MKLPPRLVPLVDYGILQEVVRPLMSGKEAEVWLVRSGDELRVAKVYKEAQTRSFKHRAEYTEGRKGRNSRSNRAMAKRSRFGREQIEEAWRTAEVDAIYRLDAAGVRVPRPYDFVEGVLVMELIADEAGRPAPRLVDLAFTPGEARALHSHLLGEVVKMLCAGMVHGDLSDFNVLVGATGPVIIDFPQAVDAAVNRNARKLFVRDVENLTSFLSRFAPQLNGTRFGPEIWSLYEKGKLHPESELTGRHKGSTRIANVGAVISEIEDAAEEARRRRGEEEEPPTPAAPARPAAPRRREVTFAPTPSPSGGGKGRGGRRRRRGGRGGEGNTPARGGDAARASSAERTDRGRDGGAPEQGGAGGRRGGGASERGAPNRRRRDGGEASRSARGGGEAPRSPARREGGEAPPAAGGNEGAPPRRRRRRRRRRGGRGGGQGGGETKGGSSTSR